jgi:hypothetical protein
MSASGPRAALPGEGAHLADLSDAERLCVRAHRQAVAVDHRDVVDALTGASGPGERSVAGDRDIDDCRRRRQVRRHIHAHHAGADDLDPAADAMRARTLDEEGLGRLGVVRPHRAAGAIQELERQREAPGERLIRAAWLVDVEPVEAERDLLGRAVCEDGTGRDGSLG